MSAPLCVGAIDHLTAAPHCHSFAPAGARSFFYCEDPPPRLTGTRKVPASGRRGAERHSVQRRSQNIKTNTAAEKSVRFFVCFQAFFMDSTGNRGGVFFSMLLLVFLIVKDNKYQQF